MKIVLQRVKSARVEVRGERAGRIGKGYCLLVGIEKGDGEDQVRGLVRKVVGLRVFPDETGKMNRALLEVRGEILAVSQFTLAGSVSKGRRPSFDHAEEPGRAEILFNRFVSLLRERGIHVETGVFGAEMEIHLVNQGPVTFVLTAGEKIS